LEGGLLFFSHSGMGPCKHIAGVDTLDSSNS
jgi:hypothetical protein